VRDEGGQPHLGHEKDGRNVQQLLTFTLPSKFDASAFELSFIFVIPTPLIKMID
jgi:hypothetical protein